MNPPQEILRELARRILIMDGAMGTMIQGCGLVEADFRGERFANHPESLAGCNDLLSLTRPDVIADIHLQFLRAGADIIETNTFNANRVAMADYAMEDRVAEINIAAAKLARQAVSDFEKESGRRCFVAGAIGPTTKTASISPDVDRPDYRGITFDDLVTAFGESAKALIDGGVDMLLIETSIDTLNMKAALFAVAQLFDSGTRRVPVISSMTIPDKSGRTLSGQTPAAFLTSVSHADLFAVGINCALGADEMRPYVRELSEAAPCYLVCYPNAGLPNELGEYDDTPEHMANVLAEFAEQGWLNIVGGCCGTRPEHIAAIAAAMADKVPRALSQRAAFLELSGLESVTITPESNFIMIGERTNVMGSRKFRRLIMEDRLEEAVAVARDQVANGANLLDICLDDGMLDGESAMNRFVNLLSTEPDIAKVPFVIDSSKWSVLEAGLKCMQGKGVVNSLSLKEGEDEFRRQATLVRRYGAAVVVMAFDEEGQATTAERRVAIAQRAYRILTEEIGFPPQDIIFDPNVLTVATGMAEHNDYALSFIEATREIKKLMPRASVSGGISNVSFSFRGNDPVREAMHAAFLYHAIRAGLDMGIVNAGQLEVYEEIAPELRERVEDVLLDRRDDATERLIEIAEKYSGSGETVVAKRDAWRDEPLAKRIAHAMLKGDDSFVDDDIAEALTAYDSPLSIIEGPLMDGMGVVGELFGAGKMFLPQVVKSARVMKKAVAILEPLMESSGSSKRGARILMATVKGDVHDIGKNIVGVVLRCNGYEIIDLGVMVPAEKILATAIAEKVDIIGLSGLITPSLDQMVQVAKEMARQNFTIPLLIGGATTSLKHTSIKIAPHYPNATVHVADASLAVTTANQLLDSNSSTAFIENNHQRQQKTRERFVASQKARPLHSLEQARSQPTRIDWTTGEPAVPPFLGVRTIEPSLTELRDFIDWSPFFHAWELSGTYPAILQQPKYGDRAQELWDDGQALLDKLMSQKLLRARGVFGFFAANADGDDIALYTDASREHELARLFMIRQQEQRQEHHCLADFIAPVGGVADFIGAFCVTAGVGVDELVKKYEAEHDDYHAIMVKALADRFAEAFAEHLHQEVRRQWGIEDEPLGPGDLFAEKYRGIRPALGYPACPDHSEKQTLFALLDAEKHTGVALTDGFAMVPTASVSGLYFAHPQSRYFSVGRLGLDQVESYARRKGISVDRAEMLLVSHLGY